MPVCCAALMCHAPIVVPEIGREEGARCERTTRAMERVAEAVVAHAPDAMVLVSPHAPRDRRRFGLVPGRRIAGTFARFGSPHVRVDLPGGEAQAALVADAAARLGLGTWAVPEADLDHGSLVPLTFLARAGWRGPTLIVSLPFPGGASEARIGAAIAAAAGAHGANGERGERWAMIASGDMSHRLEPGAPEGHHPRAHEFDEAFVRRLDAGDYRAACAPDPELRALAAEDVVASTLVAAAAVDFRSDGHVVLAYEAPFGVGYCEALLFSDGRAPAAGPGEGDGSEAAPPSSLVERARASLRAWSAGLPYEPEPLAAPWDEACAVFVTLRSPDGGLRGCVGRLAPRASSLAAEVASCAIDAASGDVRFPPVRAAEVDGLRIEVSLLGTPEAVADESRLDPERYGVIVWAGARCGVLLPGIAGVSTPGEQLAIACEKAGIPTGAPYTIERFTVRKVGG